jgi:ribosome-associated translation inhibitor RaiA
MGWEAVLKQPIQLTFRNVPESMALKKLILEEAEDLETFYDRITHCRVVVESPHQKHKKGNLYHVAIHLTIPGKTLVVTRNPDAHFSHKDCYLAIREAFHEIRRQLQDFIRIQREPVKMIY